MHRAAFTGNGAYCYANALHMVLASEASDGAKIPAPGFLECATAMPFGQVFIASDPPTFWPSPPGWNPEKGLEHAIPMLGWSCETWCGSEAENVVIEHLRTALDDGPVLMGPVDFGYLSYSPASVQMPGVDHYVMALELRPESVLVHDPAGYPYAELPIADLLQACKAERIGYRQGPYTLRSRFRCERSVPRLEIIDQTLALAGRLTRQTSLAPNVYGGAEGLERLAIQLRDTIPESFEHNLLGFSLPTAARRTTDAVSFLAEGNRTEATAIMHAQAVLWGRALSIGARHQWQNLADVILEIANTQRRLAVILRSAA